MRTAGVLLAAVLAAAGVSLAVTHYAAPGLAPAPAPAPAATSPATATTEIDALQQRLADLERRLQALQAEPRRAVEPTLDAAAIDAAVARWMEQRGDNGSAAAAPLATTANGTAPKLDFDVAFRRLATEDLTHDQFQELWNEVRKAGLTDRMLAAFEANAKRNANDPNAHVQLGAAYLQKLFTVGDMEKGPYALKADAAFDKALELDSTNWDARFAKATSLAFWPPIMGKQPAAIEHFEILVKQQETMPRKPQHAETYLFLGNLYQQTGKTEKAREIWRRGLELHPDHKELRAKLQ